MLVLSRRIDQSIVIDLSQLTPETLREIQARNPLIRITVCAIRGHDTQEVPKARIGIDASLLLPVHRDEVHETIKAAEAAKQNGEST